MATKKKSSGKSPVRRRTASPKRYRKRTDVHTIHGIQDAFLLYGADQVIGAGINGSMTGGINGGESPLTVLAYNGYNPFVATPGNMTFISALKDNVINNKVQIAESIVGAIASRYVSKTSIGRPLVAKLSKKWKISLF
jgi:hypothetical protein